MKNLIFGEAINDVKRFIHKLSILTGEQILKNGIDILAHSKKNTQSKTNQNFYLLWIALAGLSEKKVEDEKEEIFDKINGYFKECQEIKEDFDVEQFVNRLSTI